ncbi:arsenate reductase (glutaredoxin) [Aureibaculum sp. A20]|uniref:Arsenate reductase (Glutaredoxin) n=1 Tax=Aureibaculum flavum TaxID=2795986 RepID=A0ABS0WMI6_9FLAO|nr:arsenate reductase (glutaredoxin) [Aureibaculum flavum]MBJ2173172.1 arsenate reductase (glutaredoxin) [Aureibaculum flavum]
MKIYHNNRCSKSRCGLEILNNSKQDFEVVDYIKNPLSEDEIKDLLKKLNFSPLQLVRKNEAIWKENYKGKDLSDSEIIKAMSEHPKLIERPIVVKGDKAVIGRPPENISALLK